MKNFTVTTKSNGLSVNIDNFNADSVNDIPDKYWARYLCYGDDNGETISDPIYVNDHYECNVFAYDGVEVLYTLEIQEL